MSASYFDLVTERLKPRRISLEKGEVLFKQAEPVIKLFYIISGSIKLTRNTIDGAPVVIHVAHSREAIAEASLFSDKYHCTAVATAKSELEAIDKRQFLECIEASPLIMKKLLAAFSAQVRDLRALNEIKNIRLARARIMAFLQNEMNAEGEVKLFMSMKDVAYRIGLAHETFYREVKKLETSGKLIRKKEGVIRVI